LLTSKVVRRSSIALLSTPLSSDSDQSPLHASGWSKDRC